MSLPSRPVRHCARPRPPMAYAGQRIGLMGGSFNPVHEGHHQVARTALRRLRLDHLWWIVTPGNPLKERGELESLSARAAAARRVAPGPKVRVTTFETGLGTSYTVDVLRFLLQSHPGVRFVWVMGADNLASFHRWKSWRLIARTVPIAVIDRPGWRLRALASPMARSHSAHRLPEDRASGLPGARLPAWTLITTRLSPQSSTEIRARRNSATRGLQSAVAPATRSADVPDAPLPKSGGLPIL